MKKLLIILLTVLFVGCDSYLDEAPDNRQAITNLQDVSEILVSGYSEGTYLFIDWLSDNSVAIPGNTQRDEWTENFRYLPVVSSNQQDTPEYFWNQAYQAISHSNQALSALNDLEDADTDFKNALRGEALITRAYNHFMLVNIFAQHYSAENAGTLGVPYLTAPETELQVNYERGTVQETYDLIEKDLLEALPLISDDYFDGDAAQVKLQQAIATLPQKQQLVFNMRYFDNIKYSEMSEILQTSVGALKASYFHAVKKIEKIITLH